VRITYFADIRFPLERANGIQTMETCHALASRGHDVDLIVRPDTYSPARDPFAYYGATPAPRLRIERAPVSGPMAARRLGYLAFAAGRALGRGRADVLLTRDLGVASLLLGLRRSLRPPLVYESHGYAPDVAAALPDLVATATAPDARKLRRLARREARVWERAEGYVTITAGLAADLVRRLGPRSRLAVVPDGVRIAVDADAGSGAHGSEAASADQQPGESGPTEPVVAYAGHLYAWKGVDLLLEALALVPEAQGMVIGGHAAEPDLGRLQRLAERLGIADRVTFTGMVEPAQVLPLLRRARVLALPNPASAISTRFTSPLKLFEYMAAGRAIVASDLPSIREILHDGVDALLVAPGRADALAGAIRLLLGDPALAARLGSAASDGAPQYSWNRRAERLEMLLADVTSPSGSLSPT
jgi:glycosyltransferase involved in cell wall biosynthesis